MGIESIPAGVLAAAGAAAFGGLLGGAVSGARRGLVVSVLIGAIVGLSAATILKLLDVDPLIDIDDYSIIWSGLAGLIAAYIVARAS